MKTFAAFITACRRACGLSQEKLARAVGVSRALIWRWEQGSCVPPRRLWQPLALGLGTALEDVAEACGDIAERTPRSQRWNRSTRRRLPVGSTIDQMLRLCPLAEQMHAAAKRNLTEREYRAVLDEYPRQTPYELLLIFILLAVGARLIWTSPRKLGIRTLVLDDFASEYGADQMQWALCWEGDRESLVLFGQVRFRAAYVKGSFRVDFLALYREEGKQEQWLYVELDGNPHPLEQSQDQERAENLLIPELRYDNGRLRSDRWFTQFMSDVRRKAAEGAALQRAGREKAGDLRQKYAAEMAKRRAA